MNRIGQQAQPNLALSLNYFFFLDFADYNGGRLIYGFISRNVVTYALMLRLRTPKQFRPTKALYYYDVATNEL